ncbi:MAG TPA: hypothetical protein VIO87_03075 [Methylotenera sp.]
MVVLQITQLVRGLLWLGMTALLWVDNLNYWACAALPIIFLAPYIKIKLPRLRFVFLCLLSATSGIATFDSKIYAYIHLNIQYTVDIPTLLNVCFS